MKQFNLEEAKAGKPVCTRNGYPARIICFDKKYSEYNLVVLVNFGNEELVASYTSNGRYYSSGEESYNDLFMAGEHKEGWINIYTKNAVTGIYYTESDAKSYQSSDYVTTIKIEWDE